jgi:hypothetical protein
VASLAVVPPALAALKQLTDAIETVHGRTIGFSNVSALSFCRRVG